MNELPFQPNAYEFTVVRQMVREPHQTVTTPEDILAYFRFMDQYDREHMVRVDLNGAHEMTGYENISVGTDSAALVGPKEVFRGALLSGASSIILVHNHPSGHVKPSHEDQQMAQKLQCLGSDLDLQLLDFVIIGRNGSYYSFTENDLLREVKP